MDKNEFGIARTIYNLKYSKEIDSNNYEFELNAKLKLVNKLFFKKEEETIMFCEITGKELYKHFHTN